MTITYSIFLKVCEELKIERETLKSKLGLTVPINPTG